MFSDFPGWPFHRHLRQGVTISIITNFAPGQVGQWLPGKERNGHGRELDADTDSGAAVRQLTGEEKFVVAEPAVRGLHKVLRCAQLLLRIRVNTRIAAGQIDRKSTRLNSSH